MPARGPGSVGGEDSPPASRETDGSGGESPPPTNTNEPLSHQRFNPATMSAARLHIPDIVRAIRGCRIRSEGTFGGPAVFSRWKARETILSICHDFVCGGRHGIKPDRMFGENRRAV